jgi:hypothetical protein
MTLTKAHVREVLNTYIRAWEKQDPGLIASLREYWASELVGALAG